MTLLNKPKQHHQVFVESMTVTSDVQNVVSSVSQLDTSIQLDTSVPSSTSRYVPIQTNTSIPTTSVQLARYFCTIYFKICTNSNYYQLVYQLLMLICMALIKMATAVLPEVVALCINSALNSGRNLSWKIQHSLSGTSVQLFWKSDRDSSEINRQSATAPVLPRKKKKSPSH